MRYSASLLLLAGLFLGVLAGCSGDKKNVETPSGTVPPAPIPPKGKSLPRQVLN